MPVGTGAEIPLPETVTATVRGCAVVMLDADSVMVNFGVTGVGGGVAAVTVTMAVLLVAL
jgi:hypothetical protein